MIEFEAEGVEMPRFDNARISRWILEVAARHDRKVRDVCYRFIGDEDMLEANRRFVGHDYYTDIITFDYSRGDKIGGDIFISVDTVATNADKFGVSFERELLRVIIHGILHLCGIDDKGPGEREIMEANENDALAIYDTME
ncbi:MAG: rRNA maturation RNase YbeY [Muribaculaceae bacterium]|nr:rRNA maturation RNase YbeY [Muribaculaceae bacterium]